MKALTEKKTSFHTYQPKQERAYRVVLLHIHYTTDIEEIKTELKELGHHVRYIHNIRHGGTKKPLPKFYVDLEPKDNNKDIYSINALLNMRVKFEPPHKKSVIPQCTNCQRYGHTSHFCNHQARCVKCAGNHQTKLCTRKEKDANVLCVLCNGNHPANYRGCEIHKELKEKKYPTLRSRQPVQTQNIPADKSSQVHAGVSYAQAVKEDSQQSKSEPKQNNSKNDLSELKSMMKSLMEQMGTMISLLSVLVTKIK